MILASSFTSMYRCPTFLNCSCISIYTARLKKITPHLEAKYSLKSLSLMGVFV